MSFPFSIAAYLNEGQDKPATLDELQELISVIDLTTLNYEDSTQTVANLCAKAVTDLGPVASVCVYPKYLPVVHEQLKHTDVHIGSVANFPTGEESLPQTLQTINQAILDGADEIDIVFPYHQYKGGNKEESFNFVTACKAACRYKILKVILEISEFDKLEQIYTLSTEILNAGADFIKTSTGKSKHGATLEGAGVMLSAIKATKIKNAGFKASGGIKDVAVAVSYLRLAKKMMGEKWVNPTHFRIGASGLLDNVLAMAADL